MWLVSQNLLALGLALRADSSTEPGGCALAGKGLDELLAYGDDWRPGGQLRRQIQTEKK
jgi:hypothetical protein